MANKSVPVRSDFEKLVEKHVANLRRTALFDLLTTSVNRSVFPALAISVIAALAFWLLTAKTDLVFQLLLVVFVVTGSVVSAFISTKSRVGYVVVLKLLDELCNQHNIILNGYELSCSGKSSLFAKASICSGYDMLINNCHLEIALDRERIKWPNVALVLVVSVTLGCLGFFLPDPKVTGASGDILADGGRGLNVLTKGLSEEVAIVYSDSSQEKNSGKGYLQSGNSYSAIDHSISTPGSSSADSGPLVLNKSDSGHDTKNIRSNSSELTIHKSTIYEELHNDINNLSGLSGEGGPGVFSPSYYDINRKQNQNMSIRGNNYSTDVIFSGTFSENITSSLRYDSGRKIDFTTQAENILQPQMLEPGPAPLRLFGMSLLKHSMKGLGDIGKDKDSHNLLSVLPGKILPVMVQGKRINANSKVMCQSQPTRVIDLDDASGSVGIYQPDSRSSNFRYEIPATRQAATQKYFQLLRSSEE